MFPATCSEFIVQSQLHYSIDTQSTIPNDGPLPDVFVRSFVKTQLAGITLCLPLSLLLVTIGQSYSSRRKRGQDAIQDTCEVRHTTS